MPEPGIKSSFPNSLHGSQSVVAPDSGVNWEFGLATWAECNSGREDCGEVMVLLGSYHTWMHTALTILSTWINFFVNHSFSLGFSLIGN